MNLLNEVQTGLSRRDALKLTAAGVSGAAMSGWLNVLAARTAEAGIKHKSCILLWLDGGPSQVDTFDMKPGTENGGTFKPIDTNVPCIQISEHFPKLAKLMNHAALVRGMSTGEGAHGRAKFYMHTGYKEGVGGLVYPSLGAVASKEIGNPDLPVPNYISIGNRSYGSGYLGARHQPLIVNDPAQGVAGLKALVSDKQFDERFSLLEEMESAFFRDFKAGSGSDHQTTYERAVAMMKSKEAKAFDLSAESSKTKANYGSGRFAQGCLLARRLVETGIAFVEVGLGGWDTHQDNFDRVKNLSQQVDPAISSLISDLKERGRLDDTLILMMGEFGRTPKINTRGAKPGRDHFPRAWTLLMAGGGIKGGQVVGKTDRTGATVVERQTSALDFMATVCKALGIDSNKQYNTPIGRPVRIVDKGANVIKELVG